MANKAYVKSMYDTPASVPPGHYLAHAWTLVSPALTASPHYKVFNITEINDGGGTVKHDHPNCDHVYYFMSGCGYMLIEGERFEFEPEDAIWIPGNCIHEMYPSSASTVKFIATMTETDFNQTKPFKVKCRDQKSVVPPKHFDFYAIPIVNPKLGGSNTIEFLISECMPGGRAEADVHEDSDHIYYFFSGKGYTICDGERMEIKEGDALYIPAGVTHEMHNTGDEVLRMAVCFGPARMVIRN